MPFVLTESSKLVCQHQGAVTLTAGQSKLTVNGARVLVDGDLNNAAISLCQTVPAPPPAGPTSVKCTLVISAIGGVASKLKVQGKGVLLENIQGFTNGIVANALNRPWSVQSAAETKLQAN